MDTGELNYARTAAPKRVWRWLYWVAWTMVWMAVVVTAGVVVLWVMSERRPMAAQFFTREKMQYRLRLEEGGVGYLFHRDAGRIAAGEGEGAGFHTFYVRPIAVWCLIVTGSLLAVALVLRPVWRRSMMAAG